MDDEVEIKKHLSFHKDQAVLEGTQKTDGVVLKYFISVDAL